MRVERSGKSMNGTARREQRFAVGLAASLRTEARTASLRLLDLSRGGALAETSHPPAPGTRATLSRERLAVTARVVWVRGARFGLAFETPISATELFFQLGRSRAAAREAPAERRAPRRTAAADR